MTTTEQINNLENEIAELHCNLTYIQILKVALFAVKKIRAENEITSDRWKRWNSVKNELEKMLHLYIES